MFREHYSCLRLKKDDWSEGWIPKEEIDFSSTIVRLVGSVEAGLFVVVVAVSGVLLVNVVHEGAYVHPGDI